MVELVGGADFDGAATPLRILLAAGALAWVNGVFGYALIAKERQASALWLNVAALVFNVGLNLALVPALRHSGRGNRHRGLGDPDPRRLLSAHAPVLRLLPAPADAAAAALVAAAAMARRAVAAARRLARRARSRWEPPSTARLLYAVSPAAASAA